MLKLVHCGKVLQGELQNLATDEAVAMIYQPLHDIIQVLLQEEKRVNCPVLFQKKGRILLIVSINVTLGAKLLIPLQGLIGWISEREDNLHNHEFGHPAS